MSLHNALNCAQRSLGLLDQSRPSVLGSRYPGDEPRPEKRHCQMVTSNSVRVVGYFPVSTCFSSVIPHIPLFFFILTPSPPPHPIPLCISCSSAAAFCICECVDVCVAAFAFIIITNCSYSVPRRCHFKGCTSSDPQSSRSRDI